MIQVWDKIYFTEGVVYAQVTVMGENVDQGLFPAFWFLGNLGRNMYGSSSEHVCPFSTTEWTDYTEGTQHISGCTKVQHYLLATGVWRGAPGVGIF